MWGWKPDCLYDMTCPMDLRLNYVWVMGDKHIVNRWIRSGQPIPLLSSILVANLGSINGFNLPTNSIVVKFTTGWIACNCSTLPIDGFGLASPFHCCQVCLCMGHGGMVATATVWGSKAFLSLWHEISSHRWFFGISGQAWFVRARWLSFYSR